MSGRRTAWLHVAWAALAAAAPGVRCAQAQTWFEIYNPPAAPVARAPASVAPEDATAVEWFQKVRQAMGPQPLAFFVCFRIAHDYRNRILACAPQPPRPPEACGWRVRAVELSLCHSATLLTSPDEARHYLIDSTGVFARMRPERPDATWVPLDAAEERRLDWIRVGCSNPVSWLVAREPNYYSDVLALRFRLEDNPTYRRDERIACPASCASDPGPTPPPDDGTCPLPPGNHLPVQPVASFDPNDLVGPTGSGDERFLAGDAPLRYAVLFENRETATAAAQEVTVTAQLDPVTLDLATFSLGPISFGDVHLVPPPGLRSWATQVDLRPARPLLVRIAASLDPNGGVASWQLSAVDPATGDPPADPTLGFLPPNAAPPEGEGSVLFSVLAAPGLATGTPVRARARIVFDANAPIDTREWVNTVDAAKPASEVAPLPAIQEAETFDVRWAGTDAGSGVEGYSVFVSEDGGPFTAWLRDTRAPSASFQGHVGRSYAFYSRARDPAGNVEDAPAGPDATTTLRAPGTSGRRCGCSSGWGGAAPLAAALALAVLAIRRRRPAARRPERTRCA